MSKITDYLRQHLAGEVKDDSTTLNYFSTDNGIFTDRPLLAIYPRTTNDVRKSARFSWRLAERGTVLPLTVRGYGQNGNSSSIGGATVVMPEHMSRILELDTKMKLVRVQPGISLKTLNEAVATHGLVFPPSDIDNFSTVGGMIGANGFSRKFAKYGSVGEWIDRLEVVLANGEVIQTGRISRKDLSAKKGLQNMEGEIYRAIDALIDDNQETISGLGVNLPYAINEVKSEDGSFDLTPLFVGSDGSLGVITQVILKLEQVPEETVFCVAALNGQDMNELSAKIISLEPDEFSFIDGETLELLEKKIGDTSWKKFADITPDTLLFIDFDDRKSEKKLKKLNKIMDEFGVENFVSSTDFEEQESFKSVRESVKSLRNYDFRGVQAPVIGEGILVQTSRLPIFIQKIRAILAKHHLEGGIWGEVESGIVNIQPMLNPANLGQKQSMSKLITEFRELADEFSELGVNQVVSGRLGSMFVGGIYDRDALKIFADLKTIFDPFGILNPGVKFGLTADQLSRSLRTDFSPTRFIEM